MNNQKGFIQILLLVIVIASIIVASVSAGIVLHKQGKLAPITSNISEVFKKAEEPVIIDSEKEIVRGGSVEGKSSATVNESIKKESLECPSCECPTCPEPQPCEPREIIKEVIKEVPVEKIVYKEICSCPPTQPSPTDEFETVKSQVEQNEIFPLITGYKDSKGSCRCSSGYNKIDCNGCPYFAENKLKVGEIIRMEVSAIPSKNSPIIEYKFEVAEAGGGKTLKDWSNENFAEYTVPDIAYSSIVFTVVIRNDYPRRRTGGYDDYIQIYYEVQP